MRTSAVYLLHFDPPYAVPTVAGGIKTAGHYLGSTSQPVADRIAEHVRGAGSPLIRAAVAAGCRVELVRTWAGDRKLERHLKRGRHHSRLCPTCRARLGLSPPR